MKGHMQDGKFHPHTDYKKGVSRKKRISLKLDYNDPELIANAGVKIIKLSDGNHIRMKRTKKEEVDNAINGLTIEINDFLDLQDKNKKSKIDKDDFEEEQNTIFENMGFFLRKIDRLKTS